MKKIIAHSLSIFFLQIFLGVLNHTGVGMAGDLAGYWSSEKNCTETQALGEGNIFYGGSEDKYLEIYYESGGYREVSFVNVKRMKPPIGDWLRVNDELPFFVRISFDDMRKLDIVYPPENWNGYNLGFLQNNSNSSDFVSYFECEEIKPFLELEFGELISLSRTNFQRACSTSSDELKLSAVDCMTEVFSFLDTDKNNELHPAEITRGIRTLLLYLASSPDSGEDSYTYFLSAIPFLPIISTSILGNMDYNGSESLSMSEISQDRQNIIGSYSLAKKGLSEKNIEVPNVMENLIPLLNMLNP